MKTAVMTFALISLVLLSGCTKNDAEKEKNIVQAKQEAELIKIVANGYGESREKAVEDAKNDALRQFGFNIVTNGGKPELVYAGRVSDVTILKEYNEELKNGMWWEVKVEARIEKL